MDISDIDAIVAPTDRVGASDFNLLRAVVRRHIASNEGRWLVHRELANVLERRRAAAAADAKAILRQLTRVPAHSGEDLELLAAREKRDAYERLLAALNELCSSVCSPLR